MLLYVKKQSIIKDNKNIYLTLLNKLISYDKGIKDYNIFYELNKEYSEYYSMYTKDLITKFGLDVVIENSFKNESMREQIIASMKGYEIINTIKQNKILPSQMFLDDCFKKTENGRGQLFFGDNQNEGFLCSLLNNPIEMTKNIQDNILYNFDRVREKYNLTTNKDIIKELSKTKILYEKLEKEKQEKRNGYKNKIEELLTKKNDLSIQILEKVTPKEVSGNTLLTNKDTNKYLYNKNGILESLQSLSFYKTKKYKVYFGDSLVTDFFNISKELFDIQNESRKYRYSLDTAGDSEYAQTENKLRLLNAVISDLDGFGFNEIPKEFITDTEYDLYINKTKEELQIKENNNYLEQVKRIRDNKVFILTGADDFEYLDIRAKKHKEKIGEDVDINYSSIKKYGTEFYVYKVGKEYTVNEKNTGLNLGINSTKKSDIEKLLDEQIIKFGGETKFLELIENKKSRFSELFLDNNFNLENIDYDKFKLFKKKFKDENYLFIRDIKLKEVNNTDFNFNDEIIIYYPMLLDLDDNNKKCIVNFIKNYYQKIKEGILVF